MSLVQSTALHEIVIRFKINGDLDWVSAISITKVTDTETNTVVSSNKGAASPISAGDLDGIVTAANASLLAQVAQLSSIVSAMSE